MYFTNNFIKMNAFKLPIHYGRHARIRLIERALDYGLDLEETKERIKLTVFGRKQVAKHKSRNYKTYCRYFPDNFTFFVVCEETQYAIFIKMVIIEHGRH